MDSVIQFRGTIYENGYGLIASKVMRDKSIPKQSRLIYAYMCSFASMNEKGERVAFPSVSLQCEELDMSEDTYYKWRKELESRGLITIEKRKEQGKFDRNLYFIEAVPVPKDTDSEPYPKNSGTENSGTEKPGTNIISSNIISSNKDKDIDDDKRSEASPVHSEEDLNTLISNFYEEVKEDLTERSFKSVVRKVMDKYRQGKITSSFRDYLATALINKIEELELRRMKDKAKQDLQTKSSGEIADRLNKLQVSENIPFYNWLEDEE